MDKKAQILLLIVSGVFILFGALALSLVTFIVILIASTLIALLFYFLDQIFPEAPPEARPVSGSHQRPNSGSLERPPGAEKRSPTSPSVLSPSAGRVPQPSYTEHQWAALTKALKSGSRNNLPVQGGKKPAGPPVSKEASVLREQLLKRQDEVGTLIQKSKQKKLEKEKWLRENPHLSNQEAMQALSKIQLIIEALQKRFDKTHELLTGNQFSSSLALEMLESPISLEENSMQHLRTTITQRPLLPSQWEASLTKLFGCIGPEKSLPVGSEK